MAICAPTEIQTEHLQKRAYSATVRAFLSAGALPAKDFNNNSLKEVQYQHNISVINIYYHSWPITPAARSKA
jgi:hypothetical protein